MKTFNLLVLIVCLSLMACVPKEDKPALTIEDPRILTHIVDFQTEAIAFYWRDEQANNFQNFKNLQSWLNKKKETLVFAMNAGMYTKNSIPQGLYIEKGKILVEIDREEKGYGNFYLQPNGVFSISKENKAHICETKDFKVATTTEYATQSGPLLVIDGTIHPAFTKGSKNIHIRNGVGIRSDGRLLFAMSKERINFYDFASFFLQNDCKNALYLDGFVSRTYLPSKKWQQDDGNFAGIIATTSKLK